MVCAGDTIGHQVQKVIEVQVLNAGKTHPASYRPKKVLCSELHESQADNFHSLNVTVADGA